MPDSSSAREGGCQAQSPRPLAAPLLNMSTGPVEVSRSVLEAQLAPILTPHTDGFWTLHDETLALLRSVLRTRARVVMTHGSIRTGIDLALRNFVGVGSRVLAIHNGFWGETIGRWAAQRGAKVTFLGHGPLDVVDVERVADALRRDRFDIVTLVHVETNAGIVNPVAEIGALVAQTDALFFVDTACSAGAMKVETDLWNIDIQTTGSHKCLSSVPGLAILTVSDKAWDRQAGERAGFYSDLRQWWANTVDRDALPPFTQPTTLVLALRQALLEIVAFGIENWWRHHAEVANRFMDGMRDAGFRMLLDDAPYDHERASYSDTVIAVRHPPNVGDEAFRALMLDQFGIFVIGNVGDYAGKSFRVGLMSPPQLDPANLARATGAFQDGARHLKQGTTP